MIIDWSPYPSHANFGLATTYSTIYVADGGGIIYELLLTGALQPTGLSLKKPYKLSAANSQPVATLRRKAFKFPSGSVVLTGALAEDVLRELTLTAAASASGSIVRHTELYTSGVVVPTTALRTFITHLLTRTLALAGVARQGVRIATSGLATATRAVRVQAQVALTGVLTSEAWIYSGQRFKTIARTLTPTVVRQKAVSVSHTASIGFSSVVRSLIRPVELIVSLAHNRYLVRLGARNWFVRAFDAINRYLVSLRSDTDITQEPLAHNRHLVRLRAVQDDVVALAQDDWERTLPGHGETLIILQGSRTMIVQNFDLWANTTSRLRFTVEPPENVTGWNTRFAMHPTTANTPTLIVNGSIYNTNTGIFDVVVTPQDLANLAFKHYTFTFRRTDAGFETVLTSGTIHYYSVD